MTAICSLRDIIPQTGVAALVDGNQVAVFRVGECLYATSAYDPFAATNTLARGLVGGTLDDPYVCAPTYKQRFDLKTGLCLTDEHYRIPTYKVVCDNGVVHVSL